VRKRAAEAKGGVESGNAISTDSAEVAVAHALIDDPLRPEAAAKNTDLMGAASR
jgi:spermidine/putrescine-binding protein